MASLSAETSVATVITSRFYLHKYWKTTFFSSNAIILTNATIKCLVILVTCVYKFGNVD
jgi:hypothetical protein